MELDFVFLEVEEIAVVVKHLTRVSPKIRVALDCFNSSPCIYNSSPASKNLKRDTLNFTHVSCCHVIEPSNTELKDGMSKILPKILSKSPFQ